MANAQTSDTSTESKPTYTNIDVDSLKRLSFVRGVPVVERAMISSIVNEVCELVDASNTDLCITFERVTQMSDGFLGVSLKSPDTRYASDDMRGKVCIRIYICEDGDVVQMFNVIMTYQGMVSLIGDFTGFLKFTLKKFGTTSSASTASVQSASVPVSGGSRSATNVGIAIPNDDDEDEDK